MRTLDEMEFSKAIKVLHIIPCAKDGHESCVDIKIKVEKRLVVNLT